MRKAIRTEFGRSWRESPAAKQINRIMWGDEARATRQVHQNAKMLAALRTVQVAEAAEPVLRVGDSEFVQAQQAKNRHLSELLHQARAKVYAIAEENPLSHAMPKDFHHQARFDRTVRYRDLVGDPSLAGSEEALRPYPGPWMDEAAGFPPSHERDLLDDLAEIEIPVQRAERLLAELTGPWGRASNQTAQRLPLMNFADPHPNPRPRFKCWAEVVDEVADKAASSC